MKITVPADKLLDALYFVADAVPSRSTVPIVDHCQLIVGYSGLTITATDFDIALTAFVEAPTGIRRA